MVLGKIIVFPNNWVMDQRIGRREPFTTLSILGWVLRGLFSANVDMNFQGNCMTGKHSTEIALNRMNNYEFEELRCTDLVPQGDIKAIKLVNSSIKYANGHCTIGLAWKVNPEILPDNKILALCRLRYFKNKLIKDTTLFSGYCKFMSSHIRSGYVVKLTHEEQNLEGPSRWYLFHHLVINPKKPVKIRVVFDCAADY